MKKILFLLALLIVICSCSQSNEKRIESAFMEYADKNFDDPSSIMKVVSVEFIDTLDILQMTKEVMAWNDSIDKVMSSNADRINILVNNSGRKLSNSMEFKKLWNQYIEELEKSKDCLIASASRFISINEMINIDSLMKSEMPPIVSFDVKYRMKINGQPKLNVLSGYSDLDLTNIVFQNGSDKGSSIIVLSNLMELSKQRIESTSNVIKLQDSLFDEIDKIK